MFCYQCEQCAQGTGCTENGVCGKDAATAALQDLLVYAITGLAQYGHRARLRGIADNESDRCIVKALYSTATNVTFDSQRITALIYKTVELRERMQRLYEGACQAEGQTAERLTGPAQWNPAVDIGGLIFQGEEHGTQKRRAAVGAERAGLEDLCRYGLKGMAAYTDHALILGKTDRKIFAFFHEALDFLSREHTAEELIAMALRIGATNLSVMQLLDEANTKAYGHPVPTTVRTTAVKGKAIVISGHDLRDLKALLQQTEGQGINIYTHGEMVPAHGYPELKKHKHLVGNYGGAWQNQTAEFDAFPGAILMTTNCMQQPRPSYNDRIFTTGLVGYPGVQHVKNGEFELVIEAAQAASGFTKDEPERSITVGFGHHAVVGMLPKIVAAIKKGAIRHIFLIGGCDGATPDRDYYTQLADRVPLDSLIMTLACGKYRINNHRFGIIAGIPRLLDVGQCNDAHSAIQIAAALAQIFETDINSLSLSIILSWYEQKAIAVLLSLLHLGIKNIRIGPSVPAFLTPTVLELLHQRFNLMPIGTPEEDLQAIINE